MLFSTGGAGRGRHGLQGQASQAMPRPLPRISVVRTTAELRAGYRAFFESKGHVFRPSASLIPAPDDRSTLLVSAGMQPLMPFFLGLEEPPAPLLTTVQKVFRTPDIDDVGCRRPECGPGCACDRFLEFWNLVFMEFELHADGSVTPLPKQNIDTGMGLERTARILQQVPSVFDTDGYQDIMRWIAGSSGVAYGDSEVATKAHRILADHGRGMTVLAGDGVVPENEGRGYVMRRGIPPASLPARRSGIESPV